MGEPPALVGGDQLSDTWPSPVVPDRPVGAPGTVSSGKRARAMLFWNVPERAGSHSARPARMTEPSLWGIMPPTASVPYPWSAVGWNWVETSPSPAKLG